ncbi:MAG: FG-GAP repeat protein, partial [Myxococcales bacterium]
AFGRSLAIDTNVIAVGAFGDDGSGLFAGAAYIYRLEDEGLEDEAWAQDTELRASDAQRDDNFGVSVGVDGERVVIGAWRSDGSGPQSGAAYAFDL